MTCSIMHASPFSTHLCCYNTSFLFFFILSHHVLQHMIMPHGYHILLCNASPIMHVEHSETTYIRIPWNASLHTHVLQLVYIVSSLSCNLSHILLSYPL